MDLLLTRHRLPRYYRFYTRSFGVLRFAASIKGINGRPAVMRFSIRLDVPGCDYVAGLPWFALLSSSTIAVA